MHCAATAKVILAYQDQETINKIVNKINFTSQTENTITDRESIFKELEKIKNNGFAVDNSEHERIIYYIAAPIRDYTKKVKYAISISAIKERLPLSELLKYKDDLIQKCNIISKTLGN